MSYNGDYASTQDVLRLLQYHRPEATLSDVSEGTLILAHTKIDSILEDAGIETPAIDIRSFLKHATVCIYMEYAAKSGQIQTKHGDVKSRRMGEVETQYAAMSPMFFFANGEARKFYGLLGHETWRMEAYQMVRSFIRADFRRRKNKISIHAKSSRDNTLRGYNWDQEDWKTSEGQNTKSWW